MRWFVVSSLVFILLFSLPDASAQESRATLGGRVLDPQGSSIADATVDVISEDTGVTQRATTNDKGNWVVQFLVPGAYRFVVTAPGFESLNRTGLNLQVADNKTVDVKMTIGSSSTSVVVTAESPLIDTSTGTAGPVISREEIVEMPSASRLASQLADMTAGVVTQNPSANLLRSWSYDGASQLKINGGAGVRANNFLLDGFPNVKSGGQIAYSPPPDSLSEMRVMTNAYDTSIGRQAGGTLLMTTSTGSSGYHGNIYEFNQSSLLNANLFQTNLSGGAVPNIQYNEYGGTFGGPVRIPKLYDGRKRTFFFVAWNGIRNENPTFTSRSLPTELERQGNFSQSYTTNVGSGTSGRIPIQIYDPLSANANGVRSPFPGNIIPTNRIDPVARNILGYVPLPNRPSDGTNTNNNNFIPSSTRQNKMASLSTRGDHQWNENHRSFAVVRWNHQDEDAYNDFNSVATGGLQTRIAKGLGLDHVWTISSNKVLDLRFSIIRFEDFSGDRGAGFDPTTLGLPQSYVSQLRVPSFPRIVGIANDFGTNNAGNFTNSTYYTWSGGLSQILGNHTLRYGAEYWALQQANTPLGNQGLFEFDNDTGVGNQWTRRQANVGAGIGEGSPIAAFMLGLPNTGSTQRNADGFYSQRFTGLYIQDDWRVNSRFTLNWGLRWDYETPVTERYNRLTTNFDPNAINPTSAAVQANYAALAAANANNANFRALLGVTPVDAFAVRGEQLFAGVDGQQRGSYNPSRHEFQPRLGFSYRIAKNTVIRGGIGRFTTATFSTGGQNGFGRSTPFIATQNQFVTPFDTLSNPFSGGLLDPTGSSLGALTNLGQGVSWTNQNYNRPWSLIYSLTLQQQIKSWLFEIGYSRNDSRGLAWSRIVNNPSFATWNQLRAPRFDSTGRPTDRLLWDELVPNPFFGNPNFSGNIANNRTVGLNQFVRPLTYLGDQERGNNPWGRNWYDAMLVNVNKRFSKGFSVKGAFTWSKLMEETSFLGQQNALIPDHRISGSNRPIVVSISSIYELPIGRKKPLLSNMPKWADAVIGGWQLTGQYKIQSGQPVEFSNNNFFWDGQNAALSRDERTLGKWFDTSHFLRFPARNTNISNYPAWTGVQNLPGYNYQPRPGDNIANGVFNSLGNYVGTVPTRFSTIRADNVNNLDLGIYKNFRFGESYRVQIRFETFNTLNHPVFGAPNADPTSSSFGIVAPNQVNNARLVQMGAKFYF